MCVVVCAHVCWCFVAVVVVCASVLLCVRVFVCARVCLFEDFGVC